MSKILIVSKCPTHPTTAGNRNCILAQVEILKNLGQEVHFLYIFETPLRRSSAPYDEDLRKTQEFFGKKLHVYKVSRINKLWFDLVKLIRSRFFDNHYKCDDQYPSSLSQFVDLLQSEYSFDVCIVNYYYLTKLLENTSIPKKALMTHDAVAYKNLVVGEPTICIDANTEAKAMQRASHIFALQDEEKAYFQRLSPCSKVYTIYSGYYFHESPVKGNKNLLFLSGSNAYNINGLRWFVNSVFPAILKVFPDSHLIIGGAICGKIEELQGRPQIELVGFVDDVKDFYERGDVAINPVHQGTGLKIKTFESISYDKITMVHPHSLQGIFKKDAAPIFSSANAKEWVAFLKKIWGAPDEIARIKQMNRYYISEMSDFVASEYKRFLDSK